jgi:uncharacterized protein
VNRRLPSREQALELLRKNNCSPKVISHCKAVAELAVETACKLEKKGLKIDVDLVQAGALLHDLGRSKTHTVDHAVVGAEIAESEGLPESVVRIIRRHMGGGITPEEADKFGWPEDVYEPLTLEEKIVSYADKLIEKTKKSKIELEIEQLRIDHKDDAAERVRRLYEEITGLLGNES